MGKTLEDGKTFYSHKLVFINIKKITILPKAIYRFNEILKPHNIIQKCLKK